MHKPRVQFSVLGLTVLITICAVAVRLAPVIAKHFGQWRADARASEEVVTCISEVHASPASDYDVWKLKIVQESLLRQQPELSPLTFKSLSQRIENEIVEYERRGNERTDVRARELSRNQDVER
jgi:uncharacterized membrane protein